jgi:hypothetical protein
LAHGICWHAEKDFPYISAIFAQGMKKKNEVFLQHISSHEENGLQYIPDSRSL